MSTYFQVILKLFIYFIVLCNSCHSSLAVVYCCDVIRTHHLTEAVVFSQFQKDICKTVIDLTVLNYSMSKTFNLMYSMQKISTTLNYARVREFISNNCQHLLPYLISYVVCNFFKNAVEIWSFLSKFLGTKTVRVKWTFGRLRKQ